ncbi:hypothetical protein JCM9140_815 [Halalkalibacter wakoensis JCM 9140]|uniref:Uncharacterized protein n=1 Tax=Halalkalibacter wakoensis JCM 9140 TaxID=1236970 RepID=W4PYE7_9BACI|nr:hypothetical protein [Halalkalibacter wakoensis]GAE24856.1 hypothetical protein JCM9140_815 [Halalkalibacter wakoensis JCM 9140]
MVKITFNSLSVQEIRKSSAIFSGRNIHLNWKSASKQNEGFGNIQGENNVSINNHSVTYDEDYVDILQKK